MSNIPPETVILSGDALLRAVAALELAKRQVRLAQTVTEGWRMEEALLEAEDGLTDHTSGIKRAIDAAEDDEEESGFAERIRRAERPLHPAR